MEPSGGTAESHSLRGGEGARPRRDSKSPECKSDSPPHWGGRETHSGLGEPGPERKTRVPTPPPGNPEGVWRAGDAPPRRNWKRSSGGVGEPLNL